MAHDVFISYASEDKNVADAVCAKLEEVKIRCWIAPRDIHSGEKWANAINEAIKKSRIMVLLFTENSNQSKQVAKEITLAVNNEVMVIPFKIDDSIPSGLMEYYLADTHWLDAINPPTEKQIETLAETIEHSLGRKESLTDKKTEKVRSIPYHQADIKKAMPFKRKLGMVAASVTAGAIIMFLIFLYIGLQTATEDDVAEGLPIEEDLIIVITTEDSGEGSLREALENAYPGVTITFDPEIFPPDNPQSIILETELPSLMAGDVTIDGSNAGVIIDGSEAGDKEGVDYLSGFRINSSGNVIMGMQIINMTSFHSELEVESGAAVNIYEYGTNNIIGGDRTEGEGPLGQGNLFSGCTYGVDIHNRAKYNVVLGNLFGTDLSGTRPHPIGGNLHAVVIDASAHNNIIGPDNIMAFNESAITIGAIPLDGGTRANTITHNSIFNNYTGIVISGGANDDIEAPVIEYVNFEKGIVSGKAPPYSMVEIFSDRRDQGQIFEGRIEADSEGDFYLNTGLPFEGPFITATATDKDGNTSEFSDPASR